MIVGLISKYLDTPKNEQSTEKWGRISMQNNDDFQ